MQLNINFGHFDLLLLIVVALQGTLVAYLKKPFAKTIVLSFPFPFTCAYLALGTNVNVTHILALPFLFLFYTIVKLLHYKFNFTIVLSIVCSALLYCMLGGLVNNLLPKTEIIFWIGFMIALITLLTLKAFLKPGNDGDYRSRLNPLLKLLIVNLVVLMLIVIKKWLGGFMTLFPMVGVIAAYEGRTQLSSIIYKMPDILLMLLFMLLAMHIAEMSWNKYIALAIGWCVFFAFFSLSIVYESQFNSLRLKYEVI